MQSFETLGLLASIDRELLEERTIRLLECLADHDIDEVMTLLSPHATVVFGRDHRAMPFFGAYESAEGIRRGLREIAIEYDVLHQEICDVVVDRDRVVARRICRMRHRGTGKVSNVEFCDWLQFQDGYVSALNLAPDTLPLVELVD